jgi:hypothetical protein
MSPQHKIMREILLQATKDSPEEFKFAVTDLDTEEGINDAYDQLINADAYWDYECAFRQGQVETNIPPESSRHYCSRSVAMKTSDGSWVGWTYWYGGGKHGEPQSEPWMDYAYDLDCKEEEKLVLVRTFTKK